MVEWKRLGEVCEIKGRIGFRGYTREDQVSKGNGAISLSPGNINDGSVVYESCSYITWEKYEESPEIMVNEGDIILCKTASVGKVARIKKLPEKATINPQLVLIKNINTNPQYLFYILDDQPFQSKIKGLAGVGSVPNVSQAKLSDILIPIPSLEEQTRIVGILDTFTSAIDNLKEQIAQRRKQYEYYRDQLLDLEGKEGVEMKTIGDIAKYRRGSFPQPYGNKEWYDGEGAMPFVQVADVEENVMRLKKNTKQFISRLAMPKSVFAPIGTIIVTLQGSIGKVAITQYDSYIDRTLGIFESFTIDINKKYFALQLEKIFAIKKEKARGGTIKTITKEEFTNFIIPLPPIEEQQRIVSILDSFEASIQNLEAQLKQRQKQYEYYRNKLLTFE